jgi:hypothetical protein
MKRIYITESQLNEALRLKLREDQDSTEVPVDAEALSKLNPSKQTEVINRMKSNPSTDYTMKVDVDNIQPSELKNITEDVEGVNVPQQVVDFIVNNYADQLDDMTPVSEVYSMIRDAFFEVTGEDVESEEMEEEVFQKLHKKIVLGESQKKTISFTKKQTKEAKKMKRIHEGKVLTKGEILKGLK